MCHTQIHIDHEEVMTNEVSSHIEDDPKVVNVMRKVR